MGKVAPSGRPKLIDYIRAFEKSLKKIYDGSNMYHTDNVSEEAFDEITQILERDCQKFIKELQHQMITLYLEVLNMLVKGIIILMVFG
jgi:hypothetical protein